MNLEFETHMGQWVIGIGFAWSASMFSVHALCFNVYWHFDKTNEHDGSGEGRP